MRVLARVKAAFAMTDPDSAIPRNPIPRPESKVMNPPPMTDAPEVVIRVNESQAEEPPTIFAVVTEQTKLNDMVKKLADSSGVPLPGTSRPSIGVRAAQSTWKTGTTLSLCFTLLSIILELIARHYTNRAGPIQSLIDILQAIADR